MPRSFYALTVALATALTLAACSGGGIAGPDPAVSDVGQAGGGAASLPGQSRTTAAASPVSPATVRFANMYTHGTNPGPALDIYDTPQYQAATPLVRDVKYGTVSAYVHPHERSGIVIYYALPAGEDPVKQATDGAGVGGLEKAKSGLQLTVLMFGSQDNSDGTAPLSAITNTTRIEKGVEQGTKGPAATAPDAGKGEFLADIGPAGSAANLVSAYLFVDSSCTAPTNGLTTEPDLPDIVSTEGNPISQQFAVFPTTPGTHTLTVATTTQSLNLTCKDLTDRQATTTFDIKAGQQVEAYVYGPSLTDLHLLLAPVQT